MDIRDPHKDEVESFCRQLSVLSVETRLRMLMLLADHDLCVGALACRLGMTQGAVSQHLKVLRDAGLLTAQRDGYYVHYRVAERAVAQLQDELDRMLERVRRGRAREESASEVPNSSCRQRKESECARRKQETVAERDAT